MCFPFNMSTKLDFFKWRKRRQLSSDMDARFGDVSISAPNEGSWNEMAHLGLGNTQPSETNKGGRLKTLFRSKPAESPPAVVTREQPPVTVRADPFPDQVPRHPMVDMEARKRSLSISGDGRRTSGGRRTAGDKLWVANGSPRSYDSNMLDSPSSCSCDGDDEDEEEERRQGEIRRAIRNRPQRSQSQDSPQNRWDRAQSYRHRSPPLASTAVMRRYSSQSTATCSATPSTATFSSKHTSLTSAASHGPYAPAIPPLLQEEIPPVPKVHMPSPSLTLPASSPNARNALWGKKSRGTSGDRRSNKRSTARTVGPQELVPSYDELWGY
ncbi:hypothetical protein BGW36DRAFT_123963 [Talaromyces proteolyticus]|uniref:Uncharacterized protein n=1 Tax=Talaromyces proteolyticus TaxID=1131652 RepID=A0AAD4KVU9_9EURO|nr:uncharacterized protein BGW36DRAFT_123963 [Talaromyces proteolyticus]KAH8700172.1 hypothetical protein BGW36DRAFT_123963 [Talaromyces proteolyticus]